MFCINCGIPLPEGANFCYKCGCKQEIGITPQVRKREFSYHNLVKYEFDEVEMVENYNSGNRLNERRAFILAHKGGKVGAYDEFFGRQFVPCVYDSISVCTQSNDVMFKVFNNNRCFLFQNDKLVLDKGYDDIFVQNTEFTPLAIEFKNAGKYGFRLRKRIPGEKSYLSSYTNVIFDAIYDSISIEGWHGVKVKEGNKWGMISPWGSELPCVFDSIKIEIRPAKHDPTAYLLHIEKGYERRWLILNHNGHVQEYAEISVREPDYFYHGFDLNNYGIFFKMG